MVYSLLTFVQFGLGVGSARHRRHQLMRAHQLVTLGQIGLAIYFITAGCRSPSNLPTRPYVTMHD